MSDDDQPVSTIESLPLLIAVAPNGARRSKRDHAALPISPMELAETAVACMEAGAAMIHLHVRDDHGSHSLAKEHYLPAIKAVRQAVGEDMLIQISSEAAGIYNTEEQISHIEDLMPDCVSLALREIIPGEKFIESAAHFLLNLSKNGTIVQYILYSVEDVLGYEQLRCDGVLPDDNHMLLFVLGRYEDTKIEKQLEQYIGIMEEARPWMVCAFGPQEHVAMKHAIKLGGHCRVGFENNLHLNNGKIAPDNASLVDITVEAARNVGRTLIDAHSAQLLFT